MGFKIKNNVVFTDHTIDDFAITEPRHNRSPCFATYKKEKMDLYSVFYRKGGKNRGEPGDNCPFLYALKGRDNLTLDKQSLYSLRSNFYEIIELLHSLIISRYENIDFIVPMPSSHPFSRYLARILQRKIFKDAVVLDKFFLKKANSEIIQDINDLNIPSRDINRLLLPVKQAIEDEVAFSVSQFPVHLRKLIYPLKANVPVIATGTYLLVDDLTATGSTFISAKNVILNNNEKAQVTAVSLFSPTNNRVR